jgi:hypothetical protein
MGCGIEIDKAFSRSGVSDGVFQTIVGGGKFDTQALIATERDSKRMVASVRSILK